MKKFLKENAFAFYLGGALGYAGLSITSHEYWVVIIPTFILIFLRER